MRDQWSPAHADRTGRRDEGSSPQGTPPRRAFRGLALPALAAASAAVLLAGCGQGDTETVAKSSKPPSVEKLASALGCKAKLTRGKVEDYRQGVCQIGKQKYTLVTFKDNEAKRGWLEFSKSYGGQYLVGSQWTIVANSPEKLGAVQAKYGGTIEEGDSHHGGGGSHQDDGGGSHHKKD